MTSTYFTARLAQQRSHDLLRQADHSRLCQAARAQERSARPAWNRSWSLRSFAPRTLRRAFA